MDGAFGLGGGSPRKDSDLKTLTRTDFKIEFIWQPPDSSKPPEDVAEIRKKMRAEEEKSKGAITVLDEASLASKAKKKTDDAQKRAEANVNGGPAVPPAAPPAATPPVPPAPPAGTPK